MSNQSPTQHLVLTVMAAPEVAEFVIPMVAELGFDTFEETEVGFVTSMLAQVPHADLDVLLGPLAESGMISYTAQVIEGQNWNAVWEASIDPVRIAQDCRVRAAFHAPDQTIRYDIVITPKMAFGTGHHATTAQVMRYMLKHDLLGFSVLDAGSGSGVLAILGELQGANRVFAYDNDPWCVESIAENIAGNGCQQVVGALGTIRTVEAGEPFDWVLANINRNILLDEMDGYERYLKPGGKLVLSGFHEEDIAALTAKASALDLRYHTHTLEGPWAMLAFDKPMTPTVTTTD